MEFWQQISCQNTVIMGCGAMPPGQTGRNRLVRPGAKAASAEYPRGEANEPDNSISRLLLRATGLTAPRLVRR